jgi:hypothetical protein
MSDRTTTEQRLSPAEIRVINAALAYLDGSSGDAEMELWRAANELRSERAHGPCVGSDDPNPDRATTVDIDLDLLNRRWYGSGAWPI